MRGAACVMGQRVRRVDEGRGRSASRDHRVGRPSPPGAAEAMGGGRV